MRIDSETKAIEIANHFAMPMGSTTKNNLAEAIEKYAEIKSSDVVLNEFRERLSNQAGPASDNWYIGKHHMEFFKDVADRIPPEAKAKLMNLTLKDITSLKRKWESEVYKELLALVKGNLVDRVEGDPIDLPSILSAYDRPSDKERFIKLLQEQKISVSRCERLLEVIKEEFKILEDE